MASPGNRHFRRSTIGTASSARRDPAHYSAGDNYDGSNNHNITVQEDESRPSTGNIASKPTKRKKNRNRKRRHRRQSFLAPEDGEEEEEERPLDPATGQGSDAVTNVNSGDQQQQQQQQQQRTASTNSSAKGKSSKPRRERQPFFGLGRDLSSTSLESAALLDHRCVSVLLYP